MLKRYEELDGLRGVAILMVLTLHFFAFPNWLGGPLLKNPDQLARFIGHIANSGWIGVDLFFVLSGFLITRILTNTKDEDSYFIKFYARRALRIFPLYYLALFLWLILERFFPEKVRTGADEYYLNYLFSYTSNLASAYKGWSIVPIPLQHFWTLEIEEQYYLLWPISIYLFNKKTSILLCFALFLISMILRHYFLFQENHLMAYYFVLSRLYPLVMGSFLGLIFTQDLSEKKIILLGATSLFLLILSSFLITDFSTEKLGRLAPLISVFFTSVVALVCLPGKYQLTRDLKKPFRSSFLIWMGRRSYCFYIIHQPICVYLITSGLFVTCMPPFVGKSSYLLIFYYFIFPFILTAIFAEISWRIIESKILELKKYF